MWDPAHWPSTPPSSFTSLRKNPRFLPLIDPLFREADDGTRELVTSALTLLEVLVVPLRARNRSLADRYEALLTRSRGIRLVDMTRDQLRAAAQLRATTGFKTPDALQVRRPSAPVVGHFSRTIGVSLLCQVSRSGSSVPTWHEAVTATSGWT